MKQNLLNKDTKESHYLSKKIIKKLKNTGRRILYLLIQLAKNENWQYIVINIVFVILAFQYNIYISIQLLNIFYVAPYTRIILRALWVPRYKFFYLFCILFIVMYIFSVFTFDQRQFLVQYRSDQGESLEIDDVFGNSCSSLLECFTFNFDNRDLQYKQIVSKGNSHFDYLSILNFLFKIIIETYLLTTMIVAMTTGTFTQLRIQDEKIMYDIKNVCYICGLHRNQINKMTEKGFDHHIKFEHNLWYYMIYFAYLGQTGTTDTKGHENYIRQKIKTKDTKFLPNENSAYFKK